MSAPGDRSVAGVVNSLTFSGDRIADFGTNFVNYSSTPHEGNWSLRDATIKGLQGSAKGATKTPFKVVKVPSGPSVLTPLHGQV